MKQLLFALLLCISIKATSQIYIGQPIEETSYLLEHISKSKGWQLEKQYYDGNVKEIWVYQFGQLFYDLGIRTDAIDRYIFKGEKYAYKLTELIEVSFEFVQERFDKLYGKTKIGDYYFADGYTTYQQFALIDGVVTILYAKTEFDDLPKDIRAKVKKLQTVTLNKRKEENLKEERNSRIIDSLSNVVINVGEYEDGFLEKTYPIIEEEAIESLVTQFRKLNEETKKIINETFELHLFAKNDKPFASVKIQKDQSSDFHPFQLQKDLYIALPNIIKEINGNEYGLNRESYFTLQYDVIVGLVMVRNKGGKVRILSKQNFSTNEKKQISEHFKTKKNGKYQMRYQFGTINRTDATRISSQYLPSKGFFD